MTHIYWGLGRWMTQGYKPERALGSILFGLEKGALNLVTSADILSYKRQ